MNTPKNMTAPVCRVMHKDLKRYNDSAYKSQCPECSTGVLFVYRNIKTLELQASDRCSCCGQRFQYMDIASMRKELG